MFDKLIDFCIERWPEITAIVLSSMVLCLITWKASKYHSSIESMKKKINDLPCDSHDKQLDDLKAMKKTINELPCDRHEKQLDELRESNKIITSMHGLVVEISRWITKKDKSMIEKLIAKGSPYIITNIGFQLLRKSGGKKIIDDNLDFFINEIESLDPKIPYDVEEFAINIIFKNTGSDKFNPIKNFIYYSPETVVMNDLETNEEMEIRLSMPGLLNVMGIYLRDKYMDKHPELKESKELEYQ